MYRHQIFKSCPKDKGSIQNAYRKSYKNNRVISLCTSSHPSINIVFLSFLVFSLKHQKNVSYIIQMILLLPQINHCSNFEPTFLVSYTSQNLICISFASSQVRLNELVLDLNRYLSQINKRFNFNTAFNVCLQVSLVIHVFI